MPPRSGNARCSVDSGRTCASASVAEESRCLPAKTRRRSDCGRFVRSASSDRSVETVVFVGMVSGITVGLSVSG
jgi:hypothetical protein